MADPVNTGHALTATGITPFDLITPIGQANPCSRELSGSEITVLENLQNALVACDLEKLQTLVQSYKDDPSAANRIMDTLAENLMDASIYSSWQTIRHAKAAGTLLGLYHFEKSKGTTVSLLLSTCELTPPSASEETITISFAARGASGTDAPHGMIRQNTEITAASALAVLSQALIDSIS